MSTYPKSPKEMTKGMMYFPRMLDKIRLHAKGELGEDRSFYFRGPDNELNLRAQNLMMFLQIGDGLDDRTWEHHRSAADYSRWFREVIKDAELAAETEGIERMPDAPAGATRALIREAIEKRYTAPA